MSYSLRVAPDAQSSLAALDTWLQEETLDEIELLLRHPEHLIPRAGESRIIYDFTRNISGRTHYIFLTLHPDHGAHVLEVSSIGHHVS